MYTDNIKLFAKNEKELENLILAVRIYSKDIGMEFGMKKRAMLIISRKRPVTEGMELLNQEKICTLEEKETYKYLVILEAYTIKQGEREIYSKPNYIAGTPSKG